MTTLTNTMLSESREAKRALLAERLRKAAAERHKPLSFAQQRLWFLDQLEPNTALYNIVTVARVRGPLDLAALEQALNTISERHETLRTRFICRDETPVQVVDQKVAIKIAIDDLTGTPEADLELRANDIINQEAGRPFNLSADRLLRARIIRISPGESVFVLTVHHIVADEWSLKVLFRELKELYTAAMAERSAALAALPIQYSDYAAWQIESLSGERLRSQLGYWEQQLAGQAGVTELPVDFPRGATPTFNGRSESRQLGKDLTQALQTLAASEQVTMFMLLLAGFKALVYRYTQQEDVVVGSPIAGRNRVETEPLIGFFVNTLPLRTIVRPGESFRELLQRVREVTVGAYANQDLPFEKLVEQVQPERSLGHMPFTRLMFVLQNELLEKVELPGATLDFIPFQGKTAKVDLTVVFQETSEGLVARAEYNCDLFEEATIARLLEHLEVLLTAVTADPAKPVCGLPLLTSQEERLLLEEWNDTATEYPRQGCLHELFEQQAARSPGAIAVSFGQHSLTYGELNERANQVAHYLRELKITPNTPVAVCMNRSPDMIVAFLGILKAGGAYVPLDPAYPKERLAFMVEDMGAPVVFTHQPVLPQVPGNVARVICLDADWELMARAGRQNLINLSKPEDLAYVMYTSGSTGKPKGVEVPHRAVVRLVLNTNYITLGPADRIAQISNSSFDAATFEIWGALLNGGQLIAITRDVALSAEEFARELQEKKISALFLTAALFNQVVSEAPEAFRNVGTVMAGGEALDPKWVRHALKHSRPKRLLNGYGPTENTTFTCCYRIAELNETATNVPIGRPIANTSVYILDKHLNPVPVGVPGELFAGGDGLARGYWKRPELTAEKFIRNPFSTDPSERLYRTGDLARWLPDGKMEFLGRIDNQVKIRGFRIELGEIETVLAQHPGINECAVVVLGDTARTKKLAAYFVPTGSEIPNASELRAFLQERLPSYMVPGSFTNLSALPLNSNGKVDRRALPAPDQVRPDLEKRYAAPRDGVEEQLVGIWETVLGVHPVGIEDKFFDLGGHSLLAVRVIGQIEKVFGRKLRLATIFQAPTVSQLAAILRGEVKEGSVTAGTSLVEIQGKGTRPPLFLVHGAGGGMFWGYINLARHLESDQPVYGFKSRGLDGRQEFERVEELAEHYVADLRKLQPKGPYHLGGYCFGGNVAFEMARQLQSQGEEVRVLALINCAPPNSGYTRIPWTPAWTMRLLKNLVYWGKYFLSWKPSQRNEFFRWKWGVLRRKVARRQRTAEEAGAAIDIGNFVDLSSYSSEQRAVWESHIRGLLNFHPQPFAGRVHLFRSAGHPLWCSFDPNYGWGDLAKGGVIKTIVPGAHEKVLEEPCVETLAKELGRVLESFPATAEESRREVEERRSTSHLDYWRERLAGAPALLELPADRPRPARKEDAVGRAVLDLPATVTDAIRQLASSEGCEAADVLLAGTVALLARYTGVSDLVLGFGKNGSLLPVRCSLSDQLTFRDLLRRCISSYSDARAHDLPLGEIVKAAGVTEVESYAPLFQAALEVESGKEPEEAPNNQALDLKLKIREGGEQVTGSVDYSKALFDDSRVQRLVRHFRIILESGATEPETPISLLRLLPGEEAKTLLVDWNNTERPYPTIATMFSMVAAQAARTPEAEALVSGADRLSYEALLGRANVIGARLKALGAGPETLVGICMERSWQMVASMLGILQSGAAYVPLDPAYPRERLAFIVKDAKATVVLTQHKLRPLVADSAGEVICIEDVDWDAPAPTIACPARPEQIGYVIYTSGSTGQPKGVAIEHRNAVAFIAWAQEAFSREDLDGVLAATSICFDLSIFELFVTLSSGGKVILAENALALPRLPGASEVKLINTVPSAIRELLRIKGIPASVRIVNLAGEPLATAVVDQIYAETRVEKVFDLYGPSETTTYSTYTLRKAHEPATIGRPLSNEKVYLLDRNLQPVPTGNPGELHIGGAGVARGYLYRPELTAEKFLPDPFVPGGRIYRTGDLARWRDDGNLEYLGRIDHQVKIRGFRIELGEIETVLKGAAAVRDVIVVAREDRPGDKRLVAYIASDADNEPPTEDLRRLLRERVPDYMVPSAFVRLRKLPLTPNGKVDRKGLPAPEPDRERAESPAAPTNPTETKLAGIWQEVLGVPVVGIHDNFFDLGGHSLFATQVVSRIRETFNIDIELAALFDAPTVEALAGFILRAEPRSGEQQLAPVPRLPRDSGLPVSSIQGQLWFLDQLEPGSDAYNVPAAVRLRGRLDPGLLQRALDEVVRRHEALRTSFRYFEGNLTQLTMPEIQVPWRVTDLSRRRRAERESALRQILDSEAHAPFDLTRAPLFRAHLVRMAPDDHALAVVMHHTISDGWSLGIFFRELEIFYTAFINGRAPAALPVLPVQYADYAGWQHQHFTAAALEPALNYWRGKLAGAPPAIELPRDQAEPAQPTRRAGRSFLCLSKELTRAATEFAQREGATAFTVLLTALGIVLAKWTGQKDLVIGTVVAGRNRREFENLLGCFMNFLPLRVQLDGVATAKRLVSQVRTTALEAQAHQDCPFEKVVEALNPQRNGTRNALYNVALLWQNFPGGLFRSETLASTPIPVFTQTALLDLRFEAEEVEQGWMLTCEYNQDLFGEGTATALLDSLKSCLGALTSAPETKPGAFGVSLPLAAGVENRNPPPEQRALTIAATFTAEPIAETLQFWLKDLGLPGRLAFAPYNQIFQQLLDPASEISRNQNGLNVLLVRLEDWRKARGHSSESVADDSVVAEIESAARQFIAAIKTAAARAAAPFLVCVCPASPSTLPLAAALAGIEKGLETELTGVGQVHFISSGELQEMYPVQGYYDAASDELGHVPYTAVFFTALGTMMARKFHALTRPPYKVIVLDCDHTLWSGVCGEDGAACVRLEGPWRALQEFMRGQYEAGMLLCVCSKNNEEDVRAVFSQRPEMPLRREHFAAWRVNWKPKSENLRSLAQELGLGLDSFIFVDDNPVECAGVEANCPEVLTLLLPEDATRIPQFLKHCWAFDHLKATGEDRKRTEMYQQNRQREQLRVESMSLADFLGGLQLQIEIAPLADAHLARAAQLTQRTNQFNFSTIRRSEPDLLRLRAGHELLTVHVTDRFGDYGLVGLMICKVAGGRMDVDTFLLSCRVLGRGVEHRMLAALGEMARQRHVNWLDVHYVKSAKNKPALDFLESVGASFKQALNGGYVFRFPADYAAQCCFQPDVMPALVSEPPRKRESEGPRQTPLPKFTRCRSIALDASDPVVIHERIEAKAFKAASVSRTSSPPARAAGERLETRVLEVMRRLLRRNDISAQDNFFEAGGTSLLAVRLFAEIEKITGRKFPLVTLFQAPTIEELARVLERRSEAHVQSLLVPIQPEGSRPPLILVHGAGGDVLWGYANLAAHLPDQPVYGIKSRGQAGLEEFSSLEEMARCYVQEVRAFQPEGPYYLGGYCFGGNVAYEMARQMRAAGQSVPLVLLLDSSPSNAGYESVPWWRPFYWFRFARNFSYWAVDFAALSGAERSNFFRRKARAFGRKLKRVLGSKVSTEPVDLEEVIDPGHFPEHELRLWQSHLNALVDHRERSYGGRVTLLRTRGQALLCSLQEDFCWGKLATGGVTIHRVRGSHENIFMEPNVGELAAEIARCMEEAQESPAPKPIQLLHNDTAEIYS